MRVSERVYWIGSGLLGMNATDELDCNVFLLDGGSEQAIIDCGTGYGITKIMEELQRDGFTAKSISYLLLTHAHMDHSGGASALKKLTGAKVGASRKTAHLVAQGDESEIGLTQAREAGIYPADCSFNPCVVEIKLHDLAKLTIGDLTLQAIETPGHSFDMVSYYCPEIRTLFSGDNVFAGGQIAAIATEDFSMAQLAQSLKRLQAWDVGSLMPGHLAPVVRNGRRPIDQAVEVFTRNGIPASIV